jgi:hypothetical protein
MAVSRVEVLSRFSSLLQLISCIHNLGFSGKNCYFEENSWGSSFSDSVRKT